MSDDRARLAAAEAELAAIAREEQAALGICRMYLEDLDGEDHPIAGVIASQLGRLEDRRRCLQMELRELGHEHGLP